MLLTFVLAAPIIARADSLRSWQEVMVQRESATEAAAPLEITNLSPLVEGGEYYIHTVGLFLTYRPETPARSVAVAFGFDDYRIRHGFTRNEAGVWIAAIPLPAHYRPVAYDGQGHAVVRYRLVVDGAWTTDPSAPRTAVVSGVPVSETSMVRWMAPVTSGPAVENRSVTFRYEGPPGSFVSVAGSFNAFDPFIHPLRYDPAVGGYTLTVTLPAGTHRYYFFVDGERVADELNTRVEFPSDDLVVSLVTVR